MTNPLVLIIEDDRKLATIFSQTLQLAEFETEVFSDGTTALARLAETVPALVVLDLHLPNTPGKEVLKQIRADTRLEETRVILATADVLLAESLDSQVELILLKPISPVQLLKLSKRLRLPDTVPG